MFAFLYMLWYTIRMNTVYKRTKTTVSFLNYHMVFCPRYRRKIFDIPGVEERFRELTRQACEANQIEILSMECHRDHAHLFVSAYPQLSIPEIVRIIKQATSCALRDEIPQLSQMPSLWTRSYFVSTAENVTEATVERYVQTQKTR